MGSHEKIQLDIYIYYTHICIYIYVFYYVYIYTYTYNLHLLVSILIICIYISTFCSKLLKGRQVTGHHSGRTFFYFILFLVWVAIEFYKRKIAKTKCTKHQMYSTIFNWVFFSTWWILASKATGL